MSMSQEALNSLRAAYDRYAQGDFSAFAQMSDDFELVTSPEMPDAGTYRGQAASSWATAWVDSFDRLTQEAIEFIDAGDRVVVEFVQRGSPRSGGPLVELRTWAVWTLRDETPVRVELFLSRSKALEAAGLAD